MLHQSIVVEGAVRSEKHPDVTLQRSSSWDPRWWWVSASHQAGGCHRVPVNFTPRIPWKHFVVIHVITLQFHDNSMQEACISSELVMEKRFSCIKPWRKSCLYFRKFDACSYGMCTHNLLITIRGNEVTGDVFAECLQNAEDILR